MQAAIMQPYFFPYAGYFALIRHADVFVLFDTPQFIRHGWIERNRIIGPQGDPVYIRVPLEKQSRDTAICDMHVRETDDWRRKILAQLTHYKKRAPFYQEVTELIEESLASGFDTITEVNHATLQSVCRYLGIETPIHIWSQMELEIPPVYAPDEWALQICRAIGATTYINPPGGMSFFNPVKYRLAGLDLRFMRTIASPYRQLEPGFTPNLSIIDMMMFNSPDTINTMLNQIEYLYHDEPGSSLHDAVGYPG